ncbi:MAG TPA: tetratricopeptide repeat protein [Bryobacteraceae bacterium]|nr:tetratricopeptide repeat protein [Bryobacteraceae bacterium]
MSILLLIVFGAVFAIGQNLEQLAEERQSADDFAGAERLRREALRLAEQQYKPDDKRLAAPLTNLALSLHFEGRDAEAEPLARRAVLIAEQSGDRALLGVTLNGLGVVLAGEGQRARAEPVLRRSVALLEETKGEDSLHVARAANNLATLYADTRQYSQAEHEMARVLPVYEKHLRPEDPVYVLALSNMFTILYQLHRTSEGEPYLRRALAIGEKAFPDSLNMARLWHGLAALEVSRENNKEAARLLEKVIAAEERLLGPQHPELAQALENYAGVLRQLHQRNEAKNAHNRALLIQKSLLGDVK